MQITERARQAVERAEERVKAVFCEAERIELFCQERVLQGFQENGVGARHFAPSTGYGYDDIGRDTFDRVFAHAMQAEAALVRAHLINGTHALYTMLAGTAKPGDRILCVSGIPYDSLQEAVGIRGDTPNSLKSLGIGFTYVDLRTDGRLDTEAILQRAAAEKPDILYLQRSRGYCMRPAIDPEMEMKPLFAACREILPEVTILVDNCYGEFTTDTEPCSVGADAMAGSLIKNPGGGLAPTGGYVAGKRALIDRIAQRMTVPGIGGEAGSYAAGYRLFYQGLFTAPHTVCQAKKSAVLFASMLEELGYETTPESGEHRADIVQCVSFGSEKPMVRFCRAIQAASPVDSYAAPEPGDMPGYEDPVVMAAGTFVQGATSELTGDGPVRPPYTVYMQGALTYGHAKIAAMLAYDNLTGGND